jgi:Undecaprenyl-phosphate glucose phosphotransferase
MPNCKHRALEATAATASAISTTSSHLMAPLAASAAAGEIAAPGCERAYSPVVLAGVVRAVEGTLIALVGIGLFLWYSPALTNFARYLTNIAGISLLSLLAFQAADIYRLQAFRGHGQPYRRLILVWSVVFLIAIAVLYFTKSSAEFSRTWIAGYYAAGILILIAFRHILFLLVQRWTRQGRFQRRTVVVGAGHYGEALIAQLATRPDSDVSIIGMFDDRNDDRTSRACHGIPKLGKVDDLIELARHTRIDLIIVALPITAEERVLQMLKKLWVLPVDIRLAAHSSKLRLRPRSYSYIGDVPVFDLFDRPITDWDVVVKWLFDKIAGTAALICAAPIMLLIALAIKLDSKGPIFFKQRRYGFNNQCFDISKFRSMYVEHADAMASKVVTRNDSRVTRVGRFIRKTSLDELPQLFNVIFTGNMSLVGPRPHAVHGKAEERLYDDVVDGYFARHRVKPGITGWAQIKGWRGETNSKEKIRRRVEHDLYYIENWSILFDLYIVWRTPFAVIRGENAY